MIGFARTQDSAPDNCVHIDDLLPYAQAAIEPALPRPVSKGRASAPALFVVLDEFDEFQEEAEVSLLRNSARHARSILMDSNW